MIDKKSLSRRSFLRDTAAKAGIFMVVPAHVLGRGGQKPPSERLNVGGIGAGGQAAHDLGMTSRYANIAALCDVDDKRGAESFKEWPKAPRYKDFRVMLEKEKGLDAVVVATPDHFHAVAAMAAIQLGKHVYVEKPMAHSVWETRELMKAAKKAKVATQMGNQGHSAQGCHILKSWIEDGAIGDVTEVQCWTNRPTWPQGVERPTDTPPVPETLDWDIWLGPAPKRPYNSAYCPRNWRGWYDFGCGALGDMGCHVLDAPFFALDLGFPERIEAEVPKIYDDSYPEWSIITYHFPKRGNKPPVKLTWYDGGKMPERPEELEEGRRMGDESGGAILIGEKGKIMHGTYGGGVRIIPDEKMDAYDRPPRPDRMGTHHENWIDACMGKEEQARSDFEYAGPLTEMVLLGNLALRSGKPIVWNAGKTCAEGLPEADPWIKPSYREGWSL